LSEHLVISIVDCIFRKIIITDSIKTAALMLLVTIRNTWTQACKSVASLTLDLFKLWKPMPVIPNSLIVLCTVTFYTYTVTLI
jgi:hypothetical protein